MPGGLTTWGPTSESMQKRTRRSDDYGSTWTNWSTITSNPIMEHAGFKSTVGVNTPGYGSRSIKLLPYTSFEQKEVRGRQIVGSFMSEEQIAPPGNRSLLQTEYINYINPQGGTFVSNTGASAFSSLGSFMDFNEASACVKDAAASLYDETIDGLTFAAELSSTARMFNSIGKKTLKLGALAGGISPLEMRSILNVPGHWLEARYGLRPLLSDIEQLAEHMKRLGKVTYDVSKQRKSRAYTVSVDPVVSYVEDANFKSTKQLTTTVTCSARGSVAALIKKQGAHFNPVVTGWELVPYSFVIDWFVDVGSTLKSLSLAVVADEVTAAYGYHISAERVFSFNMVAKPSYAKMRSYQNNGGSVYTMEHTVRSPILLSHLALPQPRLKLDSFKLADMGFLLIEGLKRRLRIR